MTLDMDTRNRLQSHKKSLALGLAAVAATGALGGVITQAYARGNTDSTFVQIRSSAAGLCVVAPPVSETPTSDQMKIEMTLARCDSSAPNQQWIRTNSGDGSHLHPLEHKFCVRDPRSGMGLGDCSGPLAIDLTLVRGNTVPDFVILTDRTGHCLAVESDKASAKQCNDGPDQAWVILDLQDRTSSVPAGSEPASGIQDKPPFSLPKSSPFTRQK